MEKELVKSVEVPEESSKCRSQVSKKLFQNESKSESKVKAQKALKKQEVVQCELNQVKLKSKSYESSECEDKSKQVSSEVMKRSNSEVRKMKICNCGKALKNEIVIEASEAGSKRLVALFEHVQASGKYNYQCCRIPISKLNMSVWRKRLSGFKDKVVCDYLEFGFPLDFDKSRKLFYDERRNHKGAREYPDFIQKYLERECKAMRIAGPFNVNPLSTPLAVSPMNTVPKSSMDERRVIVDLSWPIGSSVNDGISKDAYLGEVINLHYASVEDVCRMVLQVGKGALIYKRDLRHAYRQIPIDPSDYRYLGYHWNDDLYFDTVLAMGQRNAAMACSRTTNAIMHMHHEDGYLGTSYLDDLIGVAAASYASDAYQNLGELLQELGLLENFDKACPPSVVQLVLGVEINTVEGTISVTGDRMLEIKDLLSEWEKKTKSSKVELQSLIGKLQFISKCVQQSRIFVNRLLDTLRTLSDRKSFKIACSFRKDLRWWSKFVDIFNGVSYIPPLVWEEPDITFSTDSCLTGCGGICAREYFHASFPKFIQDQGLPIHKLEMLAVLVGVRLWGKNCEGQKIRIYCDNDAVVQVLNSSKTRDSFMATCLRELWFEVSKYRFQLRAIHLPGEDNRIADWLSRWDLGQCYQNSFRNFISEEPTKYFEIFTPSALFGFSDDL